jgi:protein gp37
MAFAKRLSGRYGYPKQAPFSVTLHSNRLDQPRRWKRPRTIFVCSMGDLFHAYVSDKTVADIFTIMAETPCHTYMVLTKRPARMAGWLRSLSKSLLQQVKGNVWLGVSAEDQQWANERLPLLIASWPGRRVACLEPLLGPIDLRSWLLALDWVITGGETGAGGRKADPENVRSVRDQCTAAGIPFYFKQWGGRHNKQLQNTLDGRKWEQLGGYTTIKVRR